MSALCQKRTVRFTLNGDASKKRDFSV